MRTRTKLVLCAGLVAVVVALRSPTKPAVEMKFIAYEDRGDTAVVELRNRTSSEIVCGSASDCYDDPEDYLDNPPRPGITLQGHGTRKLRILVRYYRPSNFSIGYELVPSRLRRRMEDLLYMAGVDTSSTGFVASVTLPPPLKGSNAPAQPVTP